MDKVEVVSYNSLWAENYSTERTRILALVGPVFIYLEHIGSTAVPQLASKPIIDMMAAVQGLDDTPIEALTSLGYETIHTDMKNRLVLRNYGNASRKFHLHVVEIQTWDTRKERLMRDYLLKAPEAVRAYGELKAQLAREYPNDAMGYTKAKTAFIQNIITQARHELGLPEIDVWNDE